MKKGYLIGFFLILSLIIITLYGTVLYIMKNAPPEVIIIQCQKEGKIGIENKFLLVKGDKNDKTTGNDSIKRQDKTSKLFNTKSVSKSDVNNHKLSGKVTIDKIQKQISGGNGTYHKQAEYQEMADPIEYYEEYEGLEDDYPQEVEYDYAEELHDVGIDTLDIAEYQEMADPIEYYEGYEGLEDDYLQEVEYDYAEDLQDVDS